ncbi:hypothetical protein F383_38836 [Gossypium arboreum]|uniref:Uncharacterized protein n=1 Tax=Gossypium arboreum TaxID=29729 RepID=A0A0B0MDG0_GOSAR|nr:hypothetical protein F383_38836 [Gossypium arboreum]
MLSYQVSTRGLSTYLSKVPIPQHLPIRHSHLEYSSISHITRIHGKFANNSDA